jgi:hypothetical protein
MRIRSLLAIGFLALSSVLSYGEDQAIYFNVPVGASPAVMSFTTMATSFNIACPKDATTGQSMGSGTTLNYKPDGSHLIVNTYPRLSVNLAGAGGSWTLTLQYWVMAGITAPIPDYPGGAGTWRFIITDPPSAVTPSFTGGATLNAAPTATIWPTTAPAFDRSFGVLALGASQDVNFSVLVGDAEADVPVNSYSWSDDGASFGGGLAGPVRNFAAPSSSVIVFSGTEDFPKGDFAGRSATDSITLVVKNSPTADIKYNTDGSTTYVAPPSSYKAIKTSDTLYLCADGSSHGDPLSGGSLSYAWSFGDGSSGATTSHTFHSWTANGDYTVSLVVTDRYGFSSTEKTMRVVVAGTPVAVIQYNTNGGATYSSSPTNPVIISGGDTVYFSAATSVSNDPLGGTLSYEWDYEGDGSVDESGTGTPQKKYQLCDSYSSRLRVANQEGFQSGWVSMSIAVRSREESQFPAHIGLPHTYLPPTIDGFVRGTGPGSTHDTGWTGAYALTYNAETTTDATTQALRNNAAEILYFSYGLDDPQDSGSADFATLGFWPDGPAGAGANPASARLIVVYPRLTGDARLKVYASDASGVWSELSSVQTSAIGIQLGISSTGTGWVIELAIPSAAVTAGNWPQITNDFYFYSNANVFDGSVGRQYFWPKDLQTMSIADTANVQDSVPSPYIWGLSCKSNRGAGTGLWIDSSNIGVHPTGGTGYGRTIKPDQENEFVARVQNDTTRWDPATNTEQYPAADGVSVEFRIANWGLGTEWIPIPGNTPPLPCPDSTLKNNPTCPAQVPQKPDAATSGALEYFMRWNPGILPVDIDAENGHQCLKAEIISTADTFIKEKSAWTNMNFESLASGGTGGGGPGAGFRGTAYVGSRGFKPLPPNQESYRLVLKVEKKSGSMKNMAATPDALKNKVVASAKSRFRIVEDRPYVEWVIKGYLDTGKTVTIKGKSFPSLEPVGSFGYHIDHDGMVDDLAYTLEGVRKIGDNTYSLDLAEGQTKTIGYTLTPVTYRYSLSLHGGVAVPLANYSASNSTGFCGILDAGYRLTRQWSIQFIAAYNILPAAQAGGNSASLVTLALDARYSMPLYNSFYAYLQTGPSLFMEDFSMTDPGYGAGLGLGFQVSPCFSVELGTDYHSTFTQRSLLQTHVGIVLRL